LRENHTQESIDQFYDQFKANFPRYNLENNIAVDILFGAIDFSKFKDSMLKFKRGTIDDKPGDRDPTKPNIGTYGIERFWALHKDELTGPNSPWKKAI